MLPQQQLVLPVLAAVLPDRRRDEIPLLLFAVAVVPAFLLPGDLPGHGGLIHLQLPAYLAQVYLPLDGIGQPGHQRRKLLQERNLALGGGHIVFLPQLIDGKIGGGAAPLYQLGKAFRPEFLDKFIGVLGIRDGKHPDLHPRRLQQTGGPPGGCLAGGIAIVAQHHFPGVLCDEPTLLLRQRGAQGGHRVGKARLVHRDHIHVPLAQDQLLAVAALGKIEGKEVPAFFEYRGIAAVEVLGALFSQISTAKGDNIPPQIDDGKDGPVAENIITTAPLALIGQVGRQQLLFGVAQLFHGIGQAVPALAGVADAKVGDGRLGQPSPDEVSPAGPARLAHQVAVEVAGGIPV